MRIYVRVCVIYMYTYVYIYIEALCIPLGAARFD